MKIVHLCLSCFYIDDRAYQENELIKEHVKQGHEVLVVASTLVHDESGRHLFSSPGRYKSTDGADVIRLEYHPLMPRALVKSLRLHRGVFQILEDFCPDVIMFHGMCGWEIVTASRYKKKNPSVKLYVDNHTDFINSARSFYSKWGLHYLYYRPVLRACLPYIEKVLCISRMTWVFAEKFYGVPSEKLEFYPLGGHPVCKEDYTYQRENVRKEYGLSDDDVVFVQSGKQSAPKKLISTLRAFNAVPNENFKLIVVGSILEDIEQEALSLIKANPRVNFVGWKAPKELESILCAADVYLQPGSQSSTMQTSICCRCVTVLENIDGHEMYTNGNGWLVQSEGELKSVFEKIDSGGVDLLAMQEKSKNFAEEVLDYSVLANRVLN